MFTLTIRTTNSAFGETHVAAGLELGRILLELGQEMQDLGAHSTKLRDYNGTTVGSADYTHEEN